MSDLANDLGDYIAEQRDHYPRVADDMDSWELAEMILLKFDVRRRESNRPEEEK